ncbi:MAG: hypothetical protein AAF441_12420 [Pseudomonadota bacterium]
MARKSCFAIVALTALSVFATGVQAEDPYTVLRAECAAKLNGSAESCDCIAKKARAELSDKELSMVVVAVKGDRDGIAKVQGTLNANEMMNAMTFMSGAPAACGIG